MVAFLDTLHLRRLDGTVGLEAAASRKTLGCHAISRRAQIVARVGSEPWQIAKGDGKAMTMGHGLLVPEEWHDGGETLEEWVRPAHRLAGAAGRAVCAPLRKARAPRHAGKKIPNHSLIAKILPTLAAAKNAPAPRSRAKDAPRARARMQPGPTARQRTPPVER